MPEVKIRFVRDYELKDEIRTRYKNGQVVDLNEASAQHFIKRGAAVPVTGAETVTTDRDVLVSTQPIKAEPEAFKESRKGKK